MLDWNLVDELVEVLEDLTSLTTKMQKEVYMMGDFFRDLYMCREDLENRSPNPHVPEMLRLLNSLLNSRPAIHRDVRCSHCVRPAIQHAQQHRDQQPATRRRDCEYL